MQSNPIEAILPYIHAFAILQALGFPILAAFTGRVHVAKICERCIADSLGLILTRLISVNGCCLSLKKQNGNGMVSGVMGDKYYE